MQAIAILASHPNGTPAVTTPLGYYVHLMPSRSGSNQSIMLAADVATLDALEAEQGCVVLIRFADVDEDGQPTRAELDQPHETLAAVFNAFMSLHGLPTFPANATPRQILEAFDVDIDGTYIYAPETDA